MAKLKEPKVGDRVTIWADVEAIWPDGTIIVDIPSAKQNVALRDGTGGCSTSSWQLGLRVI